MQAAENGSERYFAEAPPKYSRHGLRVCAKLNDSMAAAHFAALYATTPPDCVTECVN
jgi:hypothetical protein